MCPLSKYPEDPVGRLRYFKLVNGLSYARMVELVGIDETQLSGWIKGEHRPCQDSLLKI